VPENVCHRGAANSPGLTMSPASRRLWPESRHQLHFSRCDVT
jgi:hypothetical protein